MGFFLEVLHIRGTNVQYLQKTPSNVYVFSLLLLLIVKKLWPEDGQARPKHVVVVKPINHDLTTVVFWRTH
jgi:hypothetical protein